MRVVSILLIVLIVLGLSVGVFYNLPEEKKILVQDLVDSTPVQKILCVGDKIKIYDRDIERCSDGD